MSHQSFGSDKELLAFARGFLTVHIKRFRKDLKICLRPDQNRSHAYFPALMACVAFADLLSGLYAGSFKNNGVDQLIAYAAKFMDSRHYDRERLLIVYECLRHKVAHLAHPYAVFDTRQSKKFEGQRQRRVTWTIYEGRRTPPIELIDAPPRDLTKTPTPWRVSYDCRLKFSIRSFASDVIRSTQGQSGYFSHLRIGAAGRENFAKCMNEYFST